MELPKLFRYTFFSGVIRIFLILLCAVVLITTTVLILNRVREERLKQPIETPQKNKPVTVTPNLSVETPTEGKKNVEDSKETPGGERLIEREMTRPEPAEDKTPGFEKEQEPWFSPTMSYEERSKAIDELAKKDYSTIVSVVTKSLDSPDPEVREDILDALMAVDDYQVNTPLLKAIEDDNPDVAEKAMEVIDNIHSSNILPSLERALNDKDEDIREQALSILEDLTDHGALDILINKGLYNDYPGTREDVLDSLNFITDQEFETGEEARQWWEQNRDSFIFHE
jgi:hypothetical protein